MIIRKIAKRLQLRMLLVVGFATLTTLTHSARADEPTASGLWEKSEAGKPVVWVLIFEHGGTYEGASQKDFSSREMIPARSARNAWMIAGTSLSWALPLSGQ
jgi:hypothetical protein